MSETPVPPDGIEEIDEAVPSRLYRVPIAIDLATRALIIPAEAVPRTPNRYRCCSCGRFLRLVTRRNQVDRSQEKWYFAHAPHEADQCGGESYDHAIAIAAATWVLTRHLEGMTTVRCAHRCARCDVVSQHELPRSGLRVVPDHLYQGTAWRSDLALVSPAATIAWGLEIFKSHAVERAKAVGIPCRWAEVTASDLVDIVADPKRRGRREVTLTAVSGRADAAPLLPTGAWQCAECRALPPPYQLPQIPTAASTAPASVDREQGRRSMVSLLARQLQTASDRKPFEFQLPISCPTHQIPLVLIFNSYLEVRHLQKPRQTSRRLSWDITLEAAIATKSTPPHPLGVLVVGSKPHRAARDGHVDLPSSIPFLVVNQATIAKGRALVLAMHQVSLATTCPRCEQDLRTAAAAQAREALRTMDRDLRIDRYASSCRLVLTSLKTSTPHLDARDERDLARQVDGWLSSHIARHALALDRDVRALTDDDLVEMHARHADNAEASIGILPPDACSRVEELVSYMLSTYGLAALRQQFIARGRVLLADRTARTARFEHWESAARMLVAERHRIRKWQPPVTDGMPSEVPPELVDSYRSAFAGVIAAAQAIRSDDMDHLNRHSIDLYDPIAEAATTSSVIHQDQAVDRLQQACDPDRLFMAELGRIQGSWEALSRQQRRSELVDLVTQLEQRCRDGFDAAMCSDITAFDDRTRAFCAELAETRTKALALIPLVAAPFTIDHQVLSIQRRLAACEAPCQPLFWQRTHAGLLFDLRQRAEQERTQRLLDAHLQRVTSGTQDPPPQPVDHSAKVTAAITAIRYLRNLLLETSPDQEWDIAGAPGPAQALAAIVAIPQSHRPAWMQDVETVLRAGILRMSSQDKRRELLQLTEQLPVSHHDAVP